MTDYLIPMILLTGCCTILRKKENAYDLMLNGAAEGGKLLLSLIPPLIILMAAISMLRSSGALELAVRWLAPGLKWMGIPPETAMLVLIRPISGSAALAAGAELIAQYGPDSPVGRTAAVMLGSTETTFYTLSVYFGAAGIQKTRYALPAALAADLTGFLMASLSVRWFFS